MRRDEMMPKSFLIEVLSGMETPLLQTPLFNYETKYLRNITFNKMLNNMVVTCNNTLICV